MENRSVLPPRKKPPNVGGWPDSITRQDDRAKTALSALAEEFEANARAIQAREAAARQIGLGDDIAPLRPDQPKTAKPSATVAPRQRPAHPQENPHDRESDQRVEPITVALMRR